MPEFYMKNLIPNGNGAYTVHRFQVNTEADKKAVHDQLQPLGDWGEATFEEWNEFTGLIEVISGIINGKEWAPIFMLEDEQAMLIRGAINGQWKLKAAEEPQGDDSTPEMEPEEGSVDSESKEECE